MRYSKTGWLAGLSLEQPSPRGAGGLSEYSRGTVTRFEKKHSGQSIFAWSYSPLCTSRPPLPAIAPPAPARPRFFRLDRLPEQKNINYRTDGQMHGSA